MIDLNNISKSYRLKGVQKQIFSNISFSFPKHRNVAILGPNGIGKSTLLRLISGAEQPDSGTIVRHGTISWPLGFSSGFNGTMSGIDNIRFIARIYGADTDEVLESVKEFSELGASLKLPIRSYSSGMRARIAFGLSLAFDFDCYLIDEIIGVGDAGFKKKSQKAFRDKIPHAQLIMISHSMGHIREFCQCGLLLLPNGMWYFEDIDQLIEAYNQLTN